MEPTINKKKNSSLWIVLAVILVVSIAAIIVIVTYSNSPAQRYLRQMKVADRYLEDLDYEQAVAAYQAAIAIDPRQPDAYLGLAEAYVGMGKYEESVDALVDGYDQTEDEAILKALGDTYLEWVDERISEGDVEGAVNLLEQAIERLEKMRTDDNSDSIDIQQERMRQRLEELQKDSAQNNTGDDGNVDGTGPEETAILEQMSREIAELFDEEFKSSVIHDMELGAVHRSYEEQREAYLPLIQILEEYISLYKEVVGPEGEVWSEYTAHDNGGYSNPPEEGCIGLQYAYDYLIFCYLVCGDMDMAWDLRSERAEYSGYSDQLDIYTITSYDGEYTWTYDAYGREISAVRSDGWHCEISYETGYRPAELIIGDPGEEKQYKFNYYEDGRCSGFEEYYEKYYGTTPSRVVTYTYPEDGVMQESSLSYPSLDDTPVYHTATIDKYGYEHDRD